MTTPDPDLLFWFDPVCPFAWMTSRWVQEVVALREYSVEWRFISLRQLNAHVDYDTHFPPEYEEGHTAGLRMLRVAAKAQAEHGKECLDALYTAFGTHIFDVAPDDVMGTRGFIGSPAHVTPILEQAGLPTSLVDALDDTSFDAEIQASTDLALSLTGKDVGTPIIQFQPPDGVAFFGPVISRLPRGEDAVRLWDAVIELASFPGFAEMKRSLREQPQLRAFGVTEADVGRQEDWHAGSRRLKK